MAPHTPQATPSLDEHLHLVLTDQQLFSILVEEYVLESLLYVDTLIQVLQESVQVDHILVDALKRLVESGQYLEVVLTKLLITILQLLFNRNTTVIILLL